MGRIYAANSELVTSFGLRGWNSANVRVESPGAAHVRPRAQTIALPGAAKRTAGRAGLNILTGQTATGIESGLGLPPGSVTRKAAAPD